MNKVRVLRDTASKQTDEVFKTNLRQVIILHGEHTRRLLALIGIKHGPTDEISLYPTNPVQIIIITEDLTLLKDWIMDWES